MRNAKEAAEDLKKNGMTFEQYRDGVQAQRIRRLEKWKEIGVKALIENEERLIKFGEEVLELMKRKVNPIKDSLLEIARHEAAKDWMTAHDEVLKELGKEQFDVLMADCSAEIVACQYARTDKSLPTIGYAAAGMLLCMSVEDMDKEEAAHYQRMVKAAIAWGILNGIAKNGN